MSSTTLSVLSEIRQSADSQEGASNARSGEGDPHLLRRDEVQGMSYATVIGELPFEFLMKRNYRSGDAIEFK